MMGKRMLMSAAAGRLLLLLLLLLLLTCGSGSSSLPAMGGFTYSSILSPLLRALSEHGGARWDSNLRRTMTPEHRYMTYLKEVHKEASREQRSSEGEVHNTIRLIKPQDECLTQSNKGTFLQGLSYSLDQVRRKERLLRSALLYSLDRGNSAPPVCYLRIKERDQSDQCRPCAEIHHPLNFTDRSVRRSRSWVEVDVTPFLQRFKAHQKNVHLLINISCPEEHGARRHSARAPLEVTLRSPPLVLYLTDTSEVAHQRSRPSGADPTQRRGHKRWKRESLKSKAADKSLELPELLSTSEFPTTDCALYDFRVRFSQLKLDHWIVFPPKYNPRYCRGVCPSTMGFIYGSPVHTMVQNIIYEKLDSSIPRPSCVPSHYNPLSVMIVEEDGSYVYKEFKDMVATRCTCR